MCLSFSTGHKRLVHFIKFYLIPHHLLQAGLVVGFAGVDVAVFYHFNRFISWPLKFGNKLAGVFKHPPFVDIKVLDYRGNFELLIVVNDHMF